MSRNIRQRTWVKGQSGRKRIWFFKGEKLRRKANIRKDRGND